MWHQDPLFFADHMSARLKVARTSAKTRFPNKQFQHSILSSETKLESLYGLAINFDVTLFKETHRKMVQIKLNIPNNLHC